MFVILAAATAHGHQTQIHPFNLHWCQQLSRRLSDLQPWAGTATERRPAAFLDWVSSALQATGVHWGAIQSLILWANLINPHIYFLLVLSLENYISHINIISMCSIKINRLNTEGIENVSASGWHLWSKHSGGWARRIVTSLKQSWAIVSSRWELISKRKSEEGKKRESEWESSPPRYRRKYLQLVYLT